jgi:hypothetical protein
MEMDWILLAQNRDRCVYGVEPSGAVKVREYLQKLRDYQLLNKDSVPC